MSFDAESRGLAISNSDKIRQAHNSFARNDSFFLEQTKSGGKGDAHHFIAYVPHGGNVFELDGLKAGPVLLGSFGDDGDWLSVARPAIEARMARYSESETHFALMSIRKSQISLLESNLSKLETRIHILEQSAHTGQGLGTSFIESDGGQFIIGSTVSDITKQIEDCRCMVSQTQLELEGECQKRRAEKEENARRRHNFVPLIVRLLENLAKKGVLSQLQESARERSDLHRRNRAGKK